MVSLDFFEQWIAVKPSFSYVSTLVSRLAAIVPALILFKINVCGYRGFVCTNCFLPTDGALLNIPEIVLQPFRTFIDFHHTYFILFISFPFAKRQQDKLKVTTQVSVKSHHNWLMESK